MALTDLNIEVTQMAVGYGHYLSIGLGGELYSWGLNNHGQLGLGDKTNRTNPTRIGTATNWTKVICGDYHSLALNDKGEVYGWGINNVGQCKPAYNIANFVRDDVVSPTKWVNPTTDSFYDYWNGPYFDIAANGNCSVATITYDSSRKIHSRSTLGAGNLLATGTAGYSTVFFGDGPFGPNGQNKYEVPGRQPIGKMVLGKNSFAFQNELGVGIYYTGYKGQFVNISQSSFDNGTHFTSIRTNDSSQVGPFKLKRKKADAVRNEIYPTRYPLEEDDNKYIDFDLGDEFLLAIDSTNRLWGMSWATSQAQSMKKTLTAPSSPVGNFGWVLSQPIGASPQRPAYVQAGLELLDESRLWLNVSCGAKHAILSDVDGNIFSMGNNRYGQLGRAYNNLGNITEIAQLQSPANTSGFNIHACGPQASLIAKS